MQPLTESDAIVVERVQLMLEQGQLLAQQQAKGAHGGGIAGSDQCGTVVEHDDAIEFRLGQQSLQIGKRARFHQYVAETGVKQWLAIQRTQIGGGRNRHAVGGQRPRVAAQLRKYFLRTGARHAAVEQQQIKALDPRPFQRGNTVAAGFRLSAQCAQRVAQKAATAGVVVRDQHAKRLVVPARRRDMSIGNRKTWARAHDEILIVQPSLSEWRGMRSTSSHLFLLGITLLCLLWGAPARADIAMTARVISVPGVRLQSVSARVTDDGSGGLHLHVHAAQADVAAMGWRRLGLTLDGALRRDDTQRWNFDGSVQLANAPGGALSNAHATVVLSDVADTLQVDVAQGSASASAALPLDQPSHMQISLKHLPMTWLTGLLSTMWSGHPTGGQLDAELALDVRDTGLQSSGQFTLAAAGLDSPAGTLAAQRLSGTGQFDLDSTGSPAQIDLESSLRGGELLLGPLYAKLPNHLVTLGLHATAQSGAFALSHLTVNDADALQLDGALAFDAKGNLKALNVGRFHASFPEAYQRYGEAWLGTMGLHNVQSAGQLSGTIDLRADGPHAFAFSTTNLDLADADGRVALKSLHGGLDWSADGDRPASTLGWSALQFYRIPSGAALSHWQSHNGQLSLQKPLQLPLLGGHLRVGELQWRPAAAKGERLETSLVLLGVDMSAFSHAMGWPAFPGTLAGAIPALRWVDDRIELQGGLSASLFGGFVDITRLSLQQPLGPSPALSGDMSLRQLDLGAMTSVFDFGSITGRMDGSINNLQLVNWKPLAFDAHLLAGGGGRISQRAVNNLTTVGGGGIAGGLQGAVLKLFKTFGYKRIGLNCALQGSVCRMSGLDPGSDSYTILEGSGLPHLQVIGHQAQVDWQTLVERLQAAMHGAPPQVR